MFFGKQPPLDVVTGGAGFIGSHLAELLLDRGRRVRIVDDLSSGVRANVPAGAEFLEGDVAQLADATVRDAEVVYHLAAIPSVSFSMEHPLESHRSLVDTTIALLAAAERAGVRRFVYASSSAVYGDAPGMPKLETHEPRARSPYALGKLGGEMYADYWDSRGPLETVSLRFFNVFGPRQDPLSPYAAVIPIFFERLQARKPLKIYGDGEQTRDFIYVGDAARGMAAAGSLDHAPGACYNIASGKPTSVLELARAMSRVVEAPLVLKHVPARGGDIHQSWADISRARKDLGFTANTTLEEGLLATLNWFEERSRVESGAPR